MTKGRSSITLVLFLLSFCLFTACKRNVSYSNSSAMPERTWKLPDVAVFEIPVTDTLSRNNVLFTIRTSSSYPFRNIYLFVSATSPDGRVLTDTLHYNLADEKGQWYGKGFGDVHELDLPYKSNVFFPLKGTYLFKIQHGMRVEDLAGIYDFGLRIEKVTK